MPEIKLVSPYGDCDVPLLRRSVERGETVEVTDEQAEVLLAQVENWAPVSDDAHAIADNLAAELAGQNDADDGPPPRNANKATWVGYAQAQGDADAESKTKDQLIAEHGGDQ